MNYLEEIKQEIIKVLITEFKIRNIKFSVEIPELEHGDVTSNFCLVASKILDMKPEEVFSKIEPLLTSPLKRGGISAIEFKNPGFVNFYLSEKFVKENVNNKNIEIKSEKYFGKKVLVEYCSINLFKPFNIGHLMSDFTGEYISRSLEHIGAKVIRISYPSDISIGIAKAIWIIKQDGGLGQEIFNKKNKQNKKEIVKYLGECYVKGVNEYKIAEERNEEERIRAVKNIANNLYGNIENVDLKIFEVAKEYNIEYFKEMAATLGTKFDGFFYESEAGILGKEIVLSNTGDSLDGKIFYKSEGAVVYTPHEDRKDINTSVFINSEGNPTYLAKDIGLLDLKFKKYDSPSSPLDYSIYVVDNEQNSHFKSVFDAAGKIKKEWQDKSVHVSHGRMTFKGNKMSSRLGGVPSGEEIIEAVTEDVAERSGGKETDLEIALSALRISILRSKPGVNIDFDPERASSFEGDSGPYLCYTHARCCSLLEKAGQTTPSFAFANATPSKEGEFPPTRIERKVLQFNYILKTSAEEIAPQKLVKYLFELAGEFNSFYAQHKIIDESNLEETQFNLYLTSIVKETLNKGLYILGIDAPTKM